MKKSKTKRIKFKLGKSTEFNISIKSNIVLPRALRPLCNKSLLKKVLKTPENIIFAFLGLCALGFELEYAARKYPSVLISEGLEGVSRREREREAYLQHRLLMQLKRQKIIEERRLGNKLIYNLTLRGETELLKKKIKMINKVNKNSKNKCIIIFDIPETQKTARELLRRFLKECGFIKLQRSVWCANNEALLHIRNFLASLQISKWVKILKVEEVIG